MLQRFHEFVSSLAVLHASQLVTLAGPNRPRSGAEMLELATIRNGGVLIRDGRVRALGVSSATRLPTAPEIPPLAEAGVPGFDAAGWGMILAPAGTPRDIVSKLRAHLESVTALPEVQQQFILLGLVAASAPAPDKLQDFIDSEMARWEKVVQQAGLAGTE